MSLIKSLSKHIVLNITVTTLVMATGHFVFYFFG